MSIEYHVVRVEPDDQPATPLVAARARLLAARAADPTKHYRLIAVTTDDRTGVRTSADTNE